MKKMAVILGSGGQARVVGSILQARKIGILGFFDDSYSAGTKEKICGAPLLGKSKDILNYRKKTTQAYLAIGDNQKREDGFRFLVNSGFQLPALVHPLALVEKSARIGEASVICLGAILAAEASVGKAAILNTGSSVDHESVVGDFSHLAPRAVVAGRTQLGRHVFVGVGASLGDGLKIGDKATIGAGSVALRDVPAGKKVLGVWH